MANKKLLIFTILAIVVIVTLGIIYFQQNSKQPVIVEGESYYGVLTVVTDCMIPEGCGPKYKLWNSGMKTYTPLLGDIMDFPFFSDSGLIVQVIGEETILPQSEYDSMNYRGPTNAIKVNSYKTLSRIPYPEFLINAGEYTLQKYPCLAHEEYGRTFTSWNKELGWEIDGGKAILKVRMTNTFSGEEPQPFYELWYNGNSGQFIKEIKQPIEKDFCET